MTSAPAIAAALALAAASAAADPVPRPEPFKVTNGASFTASCTLLVEGSWLQPLELEPGETYAHRFPMNRELRLICYRGKTRDTVLSPGQAYRLVEVDGHLEIGR